MIVTHLYYIVLECVSLAYMVGSSTIIYLEENGQKYLIEANTSGLLVVRRQQLCTKCHLSIRSNKWIAESYMGMASKTFTVVADEVSTYTLFIIYTV
ncbi:hypothetical protein C0J52_03703 [Blattella germanica]|nr:hypothetical protein C0J52_03703 [Blattella germanica]